MAQPMTMTPLEHAPALSLVDIRRSFAQGQSRLTVLDGVSLSLKRGEIVALVGASGAGKSTLLQIAGLLERPSSGEVLISGRACGRLPDAVRTGLRRRRIGFVFQYHHLLPEFSALENVVLPQMIAGKKRREAVERARIILDIVGLSQRAGHRPGRLSGGEQQRVAVARALANRPLILLADEPTGNLDSRTADKVFEELINLVRRGGLAALIATHNLELAKRMDRTLVLENGLLAEADAAAARPAVPELALDSWRQAEAAKPAEAVADESPTFPPASGPAIEDDHVAAAETVPAWRRVDALETDAREEEEDDEAEDQADAAMRPEAEDKAESLLHILHAVERMARQHRAEAPSEPGIAGTADWAPEADETPPLSTEPTPDQTSQTEAEAEAEAPPVAEEREDADMAVPAPPRPELGEETTVRAAAEEPDDSAPVAAWEDGIDIPHKADRSPPDLISRDLPDAALDGPAPDWPRARGDDLPDGDPVELPAFIKKRTRADDEP
jgi:lipoprotein-releasing system ATP-binding protein